MNLMLSYTDKTVIMKNKNNTKYSHVVAGRQETFARSKDVTYGFPARQKEVIPLQEIRNYSRRSLS